jgi:AcrR family transcriptional regulator
MSQRPQRRRRLNKEIRQAELLDTAGEVFREKGYQMASTAEIAERAGVVEGTIYRYFASKHELLNKVVERAYEESIADFATHLEGITGTWNQLRYLIWRHLKTIYEDPAIARLVQYEVKTDPEYRNTVVFDLNRAYTRRTIGIIEAAMKSGEFHSDIPVRIVRDMIYGCIDHHTWSYLRGEREELDINAIADHITNLIYRGLARRTVDDDAAKDALARIDARLEHIESVLDS